MPLRNLFQSGMGELWLDGYLASPPVGWLGLGEGFSSSLGGGSGYADLMEHCAGRKGKSRVGDKTPLNAFLLDELFSQFPRAKVVHVAREPRGTLESMLRMPWAPGSRLLGGLLLRLHYQQLLRARDSVFEVRLEDLLADEAGVLRAVLDFVGEQWEDGMLEMALDEGADEPDLPWLRYPARLREGAELPGRAGWLVAFFLERMLGGVSSEYGYRWQVERGGGFWFGIWDGCCDHWEAMGFGWRLWRANRLAKRVGEVGAARVLRAFHSVNPRARALYREEDLGG